MATDPALAALEASNLEWLSERTIFLTKHGSQAYGTSTPASDTDYKGIAVEPPSYYLGMDQHFEQAEFHRTPDMVVFSLRKFMKLAADCNPSVIEVIFTDPSDWVLGSKCSRCERGLYCPHEGAVGMLLKHRDAFLSRKARHTFSGYALSQLKRIRGHHRWLTSPPDHAPTRAEFGLPDITVIPYDQLLAAEATVKKEMQALYVLDLDLDDAGTIKLKSGLDDLKARVTSVLAGSKDPTFYEVGRQLGFDTNFLLLLEHERAYKNARTEREQFLNWQKTRNPERAALEAKFGYDTKHAMHLVRLMRMGLEILQGKGVLVKRPDAEELLAIRGGSWKYDDLLEWAQYMDDAMAEAEKASPLPWAPDRAMLSKLCEDIYTEFNHQ